VTIPITDPDDPRIADYAKLKERHLNTLGNRFVAESERVVRRLLASGLRVRSVLVTPPRLAAMADVLGARDDDDDGRFPVYLASQTVMDGVAGFHVHRGCLAIGERPAPGPIPAGARVVVAVEDLVDVDNLGAIARNAAAFGAGALLLSPRAADPFYRKAIRTSLGSVFSLPIIRLLRWPDDLVALRERHSFTLVGAVLGAGATPLRELQPPPRTILLLGAEGPGLSPAAIAACDRLVTIPMAPGADSLNVATAGAVLLYHLMQQGG
jgi:tRNA G18 (ribose-2'-O)-methylase SpoU